MGGEAGKREGPDLAEGVALGAIEEATPIGGHFEGEPVVLVRRGSEILAIGAGCTHYGGPLADGLVVGETIRCPWHHACFSLRTGEAVGAPALNPVPRYRVEQRGERVYVTGKEALEPLSPTGTPAEVPESVVIVGAGAAGSAAAEMLRRQGYTGPVTLADGDADAPYDRPNLSKDYLAGTAPEEWIPLRPPDFYDEHGVRRVVAGVASIDPANRAVELESGERIAFGALLLATGAAPVRLRIPGADLPHVRLLRSLGDSRAIIERATAGSRAVVLGASFIGMEVAASLGHRGLHVTVVAPESVPFERTLGQPLGQLLRTAHERNGVAFRLGRTAAVITPEVVRLDDGSELPADLLVVGIGVRPETRLAEAAGLEVEDGVLVDRFLETRVKGVFAAGDVARYPHPLTGERVRVEHWVAAQRQGQAAARNLLGHRVPFTDSPYFWTRQWEVGIRYTGHAAAWDELRIDGDLAGGDAAVQYVKAGQVLAVATVGRDMQNLEAEAELEARARP